MGSIKLEIPDDNVKAMREFGVALINLSQDTRGIVAPLGPLKGAVSDSDPSDDADPSLPGATDKVEASIIDSSDSGDNPNGFTQEELKESEHNMETSQLDTKQVPFNPEFCSKAADPFYKSGPRQGQWKKKKGISDEAYDGWYASALPNASSGVHITGEQTVDTAGAFGGAQAQQQPDVQIPTEPGPFMAWVSEMQTAGHITQADIDSAYAHCGFMMGDIFPNQNNTAEMVAQRIGELYRVLSTRVPS